MLSTCHSDDFVGTKKSNYQTGKPKREAVCSGLRALMGAVDKIDMIFSSLRCVRKSAEWYEKYFFHLLDLAIYNAYILYKSANNKTGTFENFHLLPVKEWQFQEVRTWKATETFATAYERGRRDREKRTILFGVFNEFAFTSNVEEEKVRKDGVESCFVNEGRKFPLRRGLVSAIRWLTDRTPLADHAKMATKDGLFLMADVKHIENCGLIPTIVMPAKSKQSIRSCR